MNDPSRPYRHRLWNWLETHRLKREARSYEDLFRSGKGGLPDEEAIRQALRNRFPHLKPKPKGCLSILAIYHHYNWENESLKPSLEKFGAVRRWDWYDEFNHDRKDWHAAGKARMNEALVNRIRSWVREEKPDVIFAYLTGALVTPDAVRKIREQGVPMINLSLNDKESFAGKKRGGQVIGVRDICRFFDLSWTSTGDAVKKYCVEGALPLYLAEGANPEIHRPWDLEKTFDVSFVGQHYGNRPEIIRRLVEAGVRIEAFGYGWPNGPLSTEEMVRMYSRSRINLGFGGVDAHRETYCLKGRDFEIPMSGGLYLTEDHPELETVYNVGREIIACRGFDDLLAKIRYLLANPGEAEIIRQAGYRRARRDHTWEMRFEKVFTFMGLI
jgi:spore maturation protein CgeB